MSKRALVLEDDPGFRTLVRVTLAERGFEVVEVTHAKRARSLLEEQDFDLLLVDGLLPDGSGVNFIIWARSEGYEGPILFISQFWKDLKTFRSLTEDWKVSRVLSKPITAAQLTVEVESIFRAERIREHARRPVESDQPVEEAGSFEAELLRLRLGYAEQFPQSLAEARDSLARAREDGLLSHLEEGFRLVHSLSGSSGSFGFKQTGKILRKIEFEIEAMVEKPKSVSSERWRKVLASLDAVPACFDAEAQHLLHAVPAAEESSGSGGLHPHRHHVARVLVVDDDAGVLANVEMIGKQHMIEVVTARDGDGAVARARGMRFDGAVLDVHLAHDETGYEVARRLRVEAGQHSLPIAFFSVDTSLTSRVRAAHAGASLFIDKADSDQEFPAAVRHLAALRQEVKPRVVVLVDDLPLAESVGSALAAGGLEVEVATDPGTLLETIASHHPSLLLVQGSMRRVSGFDVCKMVRNTTAWRDLPVLLVTDSESPETRRACFDAGADDFVSLPLDLEELGARMRVLLERVRLHRERADRDGLTGLLLRRAFLEAFKARFSEAQRSLVPLSLCVLDLDHFKRLNDERGHAAGDRVLSGFGSLLASRFRASDIRGRWGGEEFAVVLYGEEGDVAGHILDRVREEFQEIEFEADDGSKFHASFSAGVASFPSDGGSFQSLFRVADERLYRAKDEGRGRVCCESVGAASSGIRAA